MAALVCGLWIDAHPAAAAELTPAVQSELRRGLAMVGTRTSDEPALRLERQNHDPSPAFALGAALGAWSNAWASLDYDLKNPSGDGNDSGAIATDCYDEKTTFTHLESRAQASGLTQRQVVDGAGLVASGVLAAWATRPPGGPPRCR
jgi:hypothetical protein